MFEHDTQVETEGCVRGSTEEKEIIPMVVAAQHGDLAAVQALLQDGYQTGGLTYVQQLLAEGIYTFCNGCDRRTLLVPGPNELRSDLFVYCLGGVRCATKTCVCCRMTYVITIRIFVAGGHTHTLKWMLEQLPPCPVDICTIAYAAAENTEALMEIHDCLIAHGAKIATQELHYVAMDHTVFLKYQDKGAVTWPDTCSEAQSILQGLRSGCMSEDWIFAYVFNKTKHLFETSMDVDSVAELLPYCNKEDVKELLERVYSAKTIRAFMLSSIKEGDLETFQWLHLVATQSTATDLHLPGQLHTDQGLWYTDGSRVLDDGLRYTDGSSIYAETAALHGELAHLCFIFQNQPRFKWSRKLLRIAASRGHLHVLTWARAQSLVCPWGDNRRWNALSRPCAVFLERSSRPLTRRSKNALNRARRTSLACCLKRKGFHATLVCHVLLFT